MSRAGLVTALVMVGSTAIADPDPTSAALRAGFGEEATVEGFAKVVASPLPIAGLSFTDPACDRAFGRSRDVPRGELASLFGCLHAAHAAVDVQPSGVALYYGDPAQLWMIASLELAHGRVDRIAPWAAGRADAAMPTFAVSYRGFSPSERVIKATASRKPARMSAQVKLCLAADGAIAGRRLAVSSGFSDFDADVSDFMTAIDREAIHTELQPPLPSCAIVFVSYPYPPPPPPPPPPPDSSHGPMIVAPTTLEPNRVAGTKDIVPDIATKTKMQRDGRDRIVGSYKFCLDTTGTPVDVRVLKPSGYDAYDDLIRATIANDWRYKPFDVKGEAVPVCTAVTFIYTQN